MNNQNPNVPGQNNLLRGFYQHQQNKIPFQQNPLLNNNPMFRSNMDYNKSNQMQQMRLMQMAQHMNRLKYLQHIKTMEKLNELEKMDEKDLKDQIIKPEKIQKKKEDKEELEAGFTVLEGVYKTEDSFKKGASKYWKERTNQPYKNIIKDEKYYKQFLTEDKRKKLDNRDELIVHKVTDVDKDKDRLEKEYVEKDKEIVEHDGELKVIYATSKEAEHKQKFDYNHVYKFRVKYDPSDHSNLKKSKIDLYKKEQKKIEKDKKNMIDIIDSLINDDLLSPDQLKKLGITNDKDTVEVDMNVLEKELKEQLGDAYDSIEDKAKMQIEKELDEASSESETESESESESEDDSESESESEDSESESESDSDSEEEVKVNRVRVRVGKRRN